MKYVTCNQYRELISSAIDGEIDPPKQQELDTHLGTCDSCTSYQHDAWRLHRSMQMRAVPTTHDAEQPPPIHVSVAGNTEALALLRWALFVIGGTLVLLNVQAFLSVGADGAAHLSRHDGVFGTALGIGMIAVAAKPHRAIGLVPLTSTIAVLMIVVAAVDLVSGEANMVAEAIHVVEFAGLVCLWVISGGPMRLQNRADSVARRFDTSGAASV